MDDEGPYPLDPDWHGECWLHIIQLRSLPESGLRKFSANIYLIRYLESGRQAK